MQIFNCMLSYKQPVSKYNDLSLTVKCWIHLEELIISTNTVFSKVAILQSTKPRQDSGNFLDQRGFFCPPILVDAFFQKSHSKKKLLWKTFLFFSLSIGLYQ